MHKEYIFNQDYTHCSEYFKPSFAKKGSLFRLDEDRGDGWYLFLNPDGIKERHWRISPKLTEEFCNDGIISPNLIKDKRFKATMKEAEKKAAEINSILIVGGESQSPCKIVQALEECKAHIISSRGKNDKLNNIPENLPKLYDMGTLFIKEEIPVKKRHLPKGHEHKNKYHG